jgi:hypothetical protein
MDTVTGPARRRIALISVGAVAVIAAGVLAGVLTTGPPPPGTAPAARGAGQPPVLQPPANLPTATVPAGSAAAVDTAVRQGVRLPLPPGWRVTTVAGPLGPMGCVLAPGQRAATRPGECTVTAAVVTGHPVDSSFVNPDAPYLGRVRQPSRRSGVLGA